MTRQRLFAVASPASKLRASVAAAAVRAAKLRADCNTAPGCDPDAECCERCGDLRVVSRADAGEPLCAQCATDEDHRCPECGSYEGGECPECDQTRTSEQMFG